MSKETIRTPSIADSSDDCKAEHDLRWSVRRRLAFLEFRLYWGGRVNRADLVDHFSISVPQASADLQLYQKLSERNLVYDKREKSYVLTADFEPLFAETMSDLFLEQLRSLELGSLPADQFWPGYSPPTDLIRSLRRRARGDIVWALVKAIRERSALHVEYASLTREAPAWRWISPHALAHDGYRWHARAFCHERKEFKDYVIGRILQSEKFAEAEGNSLEDHAWHRRVRLRIEPHPALPEPKRRALAIDFEMHDGYVEVETRVCLSQYLERFLGLDLPDSVSAERQQIRLVNRAEVEAVRKELGADWG